MKILRTRLTFANVTSCMALFVALGGLAAAAGLPKNSVGTKQLKKNAVTGAKVKDEAITGAKVQKGTLTGTQINVSTLGTVPNAMSAQSAMSAQNAMSAQSLGGMSADQIVQSSKLQCPAGTELAAGICFETSQRPEATWQEALEICGKADRSLPSVGGFAAYALASQQPVFSWAESLFTDEGTFTAPVVSGNGAGALSMTTTVISETRKFLCSTPPTN